MNNITIGIIGGMGPEATGFFFNKILALTPASRDQDHIPVLINSNPGIPDRTAAILSGDTRQAGQALRSAAVVLEDAGASFLTMPCNTAHFWIEEIRDAVTIPVLDMIDVTMAYLQTERKIVRVGLLSTVGTARTGLYQNAARVHGIEIVLPDADDADMVSAVIGEVKKGNKSASLREEIDFVRENTGAQDYVLGCTELPLVFASTPDWAIDPMDVLARAAVSMAKKNPT